MFHNRRFHPLTLSAALAPLFAAAPSSFDPELFMNTKFNAPLSTKMIPIPPGEYNAIIDEVKPPRVNADGSVVMDVTWLIDDQRVKDATKRDKNTVRQSLWLDFENGQLSSAEGKNVSLGRLRTALNQNSGNDWSPSMLKGGVAKVKVVSNINKDTGEDFGKVVAVSPLS